MQEEKEWLVKTSTRILGPFSLDEVKMMLYRKHISIIDEVTQPNGRWEYVREHKILKDIVAKMRYEQDHSVENTANQTGSGTVTSTATLTMQTSTANLTKTSEFLRTDNQTKTGEIVRTEDLTPTPVLKTSGHNSLPNLGIKDVVALKETNNYNTESSRANNVLSYGFENDARVQSEIKKKSQFWRFALLGVAAVLLLLLMVSQLVSYRSKSSAQALLVRNVIHFKTLKLYDKSLSSYRQAKQNKELADDVNYEIAPLLIAFDRQTLQGRKYLENALLNGKVGRNQMADTYTAIGLSYLYEGDIRSAEENFIKALGFEPNSYYAQMNLSMLKLRKGETKDQIKVLHELKDHGLHPAFTAIMRSIYIIDKTKVSPDDSLNRQAAADLAQVVQKSSELRAEALLLKAYHEALVRNFDSARRSIDQLLEQIPQESHNYVRSYLLDWRLLDWENMEKYCFDIYKMMGVSPRTKTLRAICYLNAGRDADANQYITQASKEAASDPMVLSAQLYINMKTHHLQEAQVMLRLPQLDSTTARAYAQGHVCLNKPENFQCAEGAFQNVQSRLKDDPAPFYYLARTAYQKKNRTVAVSNIKQGLELSENYIPLLELRDQLESED